MRKLHLRLRMKHHTATVWKKTAVLVGLAAAAVLAKMTAPDLKRYVRIKTM